MVSKDSKSAGRKTVQSRTHRKAQTQATFEEQAEVGPNGIIPKERATTAKKRSTSAAKSVKSAKSTKSMRSKKA